MARPPARSALQAAIQIGTWAEDEEFGIHPYGSKSKRTLVAPAAATHPLLIPGHKYLFKKADDWKAQQMWSEALAFQIGAVAGLPVPPCFVAIDETTDEAGALIEFFYGYPGEQRAARLEHGADLLQGAGLMDGGGRPHAISVNLAYCEAAAIPDAHRWWGAVLAFDAMIGNTDRHSQNWGLLVDADGRRRLAPMFDNGTSLAYQIAEGALTAATRDEALQRFVSKGRHSADWTTADPHALNHVGLCERFAAAHPDAAGAMRKALDVSDAAVAGFLQDCIAIDVVPRFTAERAAMVAALIARRRDLVLQALRSIR